MVDPAPVGARDGRFGHQNRHGGHDYGHDGEPDTQDLQKLAHSGALLEPQAALQLDDAVVQGAQAVRVAHDGRLIGHPRTSQLLFGPGMSLSVGA